VKKDIFFSNMSHTYILGEKAENNWWDKNKRVDMLEGEEAVEFNNLIDELKDNLKRREK